MRNREGRKKLESACFVYRIQPIASHRRRTPIIPCTYSFSLCPSLAPKIAVTPQNVASFVSFVCIRTLRLPPSSSKPLHPRLLHAHTPFPSFSFDRLLVSTLRSFLVPILFSSLIACFPPVCLFVQYVMLVPTSVSSCYHPFERVIRPVIEGEVEESERRICGMSEMM